MPFPAPPAPRSRRRVHPFVAFVALGVGLAHCSGSPSTSSSGATGDGGESTSSSGGSTSSGSSGPTCSSGVGQCSSSYNHCRCGSSCYRNSPAVGSYYACHLLCETDDDCVNVFSKPATCQPFTASGGGGKECR